MAPMAKPDHPSLARVKSAFGDVKLMASQFRGQTTLVVPSEHAHAVLRFLRDDPDCDYDFLADVMFGGALTLDERQMAIDYLNTDDLGVPTPYDDTRIRQTVGLLLGYPQFQEQ